MGKDFKQLVNYTITFLVVVWAFGSLVISFHKDQNQVLVASEIDFFYRTVSEKFNYSEILSCEEANLGQARRTKNLLLGDVILELKDLRVEGELVFSSKKVPLKVLLNEIDNSNLVKYLARYSILNLDIRSSCQGWDSIIQKKVNRAPASSKTKVYFDLDFYRMMDSRSSGNFIGLLSCKKSIGEEAPLSIIHIFETGKGFRNCMSSWDKKFSYLKERKWFCEDGKRMIDKCHDGMGLNYILKKAKSRISSSKVYLTFNDLDEKFNAMSFENVGEMLPTCFRTASALNLLGFKASCVDREKQSKNDIIANLKRNF
jgi:hypothetical protein